MEQYTTDLDTPLIGFSSESADTDFTIRNAVEGVQIFGGIGSGKTSGSGRMIALKYLSNGFGGLVLTAKQDEKMLWEDYCRTAGRSDDLIIVEPGLENYFNFLEYESSHHANVSFSQNVVQVLKTVIRASEEKSSSKTDDAFWENALDQYISNIVDLSLIAYGKADVQVLFDIAQSAPRRVNKRTDITGDEQIEVKKQLQESPFALAYETAREKVVNQLDQWQKVVGPASLQKLKGPAFLEAQNKAVPDLRVLQMVDNFFSETLPGVGEKTRATIDFSLSGFLFRLLQDPIYSLFCQHSSNFTPEASLAGKIILLNLPVKLYNKAGRDSQILFKYVWQRAMEKRDVTENGRPVFLWADESQHFLHEHDADFQATARSSRIATVYISQNLPNYFANMGGDHGNHKIKSFLGTLSTKIFHANADTETNQYASELIGSAYTENHNRSTQVGGGFSLTRGVSYILEQMVRPEEFGLLQTGGPKNNFLTESYVHCQGKIFQNGFNFKKVFFHQTMVINKNVQL